MKSKLLQFTMLTISIATMIIFGCNKDGDEKPKVNQMPACQIKAPPNGQQIEAGKSVTILVDAIDHDGTVEEVLFFVDGIKMGQANLFPFSYLWNTFGDSIGNHLLKAIVTDNEGAQSSDEISVEIIQSDGGPNGCEGIIEINYGGQTYNTVEIGNQCWLKENLNYASGNSWCYDNDPSNCETYGRLYDWETALTVCPDGWHLPTDAEWCALEQEVDLYITCNTTGHRGLHGGGKLKEAGTTHWKNPNVGAINSSDFTALPGGYRGTNASYFSVGFRGFWWTSSQYSASSAWYRGMYNENTKVGRFSDNKSFGSSVRCIKD